MPPELHAPRPSLVANGTALHRQVFLVLRDEISGGTYGAGSPLPREEDLCLRFGVSRITVRRALADLAAQGYVDRRQGVGNFVPKDRPAPRTRPTLGFVDALRRTAMETEVTVLLVERAAPPTAVAELLQLEPGAKAVHAIRLRSVGGTPVIHTDAWVPLSLGVGVTASALRRRALYELLLDQGVVLGRVVQEVTAFAADPIRAQALKTEIGSPLLRVIRLMHGQDARPVEYVEVTLPPDRARFLMDIPADDVNTLSAGQVVPDEGLFGR